MSEKDKMEAKAREAAARAEMHDKAAHGDWYGDPINYFAAQSERQAAQRYWAQAQASEENKKEADK